ncbi:MAG: alanine racemase [Phormidesmis sp.]
MLNWDETPALEPMRCARAWVEINRSAIAHNVSAIKALLAPHTDLMAVVKADAYGHGAVTVAQTALRSGASWLGVATVPEGIELRQAGIEAPILVMGAVNDPAEVRAIAYWQLQPTIVNPKQALVFSETLAAYAAERAERGRQAMVVEQASLSVPVHLKLDTGMSRLGFSWQRPVELARLVQQLAHLETVSVYSHLATADDPDPTVMQQQHERFERATSALDRAGLLPPRRHLANTAATLSSPALHHDMVRVGLATYGLYPAPHLRSAVDLQPVLEVKARITHLKTIPAGAGVSYSHQFIAPQTMKIAVLGIGYADGIPRILSNRLEGVLQGQRVQQVGAITMDQMMVDVSAVAAVQEGDVVTLLGQAGGHVLSADHWAEMANTISWEILCGFKHRLPRIEIASVSMARLPEPTYKTSP